MLTRNRSCSVLAFALVFELAAGAAWAQHSHSSHHFASPGAGPGMGPVMGAGPHSWHAPALFAVSGGGYTYGYGFPFYGGFAFNAVPFGYAPPFLMTPGRWVRSSARSAGRGYARGTDAPSGAVR